MALDPTTVKARIDLRVSQLRLLAALDRSKLARVRSRSSSRAVLVATAAEDRLNFRRNPYTSFLRQPAMRCCNVALIRPQHPQRPRSIRHSAFSRGR
jgi:hypothetical protein